MSSKRWEKYSVRIRQIIFVCFAFILMIAISFTATNTILRGHLAYEAQEMLRVAELTIASNLRETLTALIESSFTKQVSAGMLISADVMQNISEGGQNFNFRYLGMVNPAGSREANGVFEILDALPEDKRKKRLKTKEVFESAVRNFLTEKYQVAADRFKKVMEFDPGDECARLFYDKAKACVNGTNKSSVFSFNEK